MSKEELIEKAKAGRVDFNGTVAIDGVWNGESFDVYFVMYADKDGFHACPEDEEDYIDDYEPFYFDEIEDEVYDQLISDIIK